LHTGPDTCFVTDQKGCKTKAGFNVTEPAALIITTSTSPSLCQGANGTASIGPVGGTLPYVYSWSPVAGSGSVLSNLIAGNYTCVVTDTKGCIASVVLVVNNATTAPKALISSAGPTTFCAGKSQVLTVSGGLSYSWSTGATAASITVNSPGLYWAWAFTTCGKDSASIQITVNPLPVPVIRGDTSMCTGVPVTLTASGGTGYSWSTSATTASCTVNTGGTYTVVVSNGCGSVSGSFTVTEHTIHAAFSTDATSGTIPFSVVLHDKSVPTPKNWSWNFGDNTNGLGPQTTHTFDVSGNYIILLTVTDSFGCTDTCTKAIEALEQPSWLEVPNVFTPNGDGDNDLFLVRSFGITYFHASIYDRWGLLLTELFAADQGWDGRTSAGGVCTDGTYYYLIQALGKDKKRYNLQGFMELLR
jgi:gliding motility-associated-like protein